MDGKQYALYKISFVGRAVCQAGCVPISVQMVKSSFTGALLILNGQQTSLEPVHTVPAQLGLHTVMPCMALRVQSGSSMPVIHRSHFCD